MSDKPGVGSNADKRSSFKPQDDDKKTADRGQSGGKNWAEDKDVVQADAGDTSVDSGANKSSK